MLKIPFIHPYTNESQFGSDGNLTTEIDKIKLHMMFSLISSHKHIVSHNQLSVFNKIIYSTELKLKYTNGLLSRV